MATIMRKSVKKIFHLFKSVPSNYTEGTRLADSTELSDARINIEITHKESDKHDNVTEFWFRPNQPINLKKVIINIEDDEDAIEGNSTVEYKENNWHILAGYEDVRAGDNWKFTFVYSLAGQSETFTFNIKYTI